MQGNDDPSVADELGLQLFTLNGKLPLETRLAGRLHGKPIQEIPLQTRIGVNEELKVEIRWGVAAVDHLHDWEYRNEFRPDILANSQGADRCINGRIEGGSAGTRNR
ncbi:MAG: hypothetical protein ACLPWF_31775 [Bryobacteraceae bacterium]